MYTLKETSEGASAQSRLVSTLKRLVRSVSSMSGEFGTSAFSLAMLVFLVQEARAKALSQDATLTGQPMDTSDLDAVRQIFGNSTGDQVAGIDYTAIADAVARISDLYAQEALEQDASGEDLTAQDPAAGAEQGVLDAELETVGRYLQDAVQYAQLSTEGAVIEGAEAATAGQAAAGAATASAGLASVLPALVALVGLAALGSSGSTSSSVNQVPTVNNAPTFTSQGPTTVSETGAAFNLSLLAGASDADAGETATLTVDQLLYKVGAANATAIVPNGLSLLADGKTLVINPGTFSYLNDGQTLDIVISYHVKDVNGAYVEVTTTVTVNGSGTLSTETKSNPGTVINGYISGATVFQDLNGDGVWQEGEPKTTTGADGTFNLNVIEGNSSPIVMFGGTDLSTGLAYTNILKGPVGSTTITPLTTLVASLVASGKTQSEALSAMREAFGLPADFDLLNFDPVAKADDPDFAAVALQVKAAGVLVANLMGAGGSALAGASGGDASALSSTMAASIAAKLAALGSGGLAALSDSSTLLAILNASASSAGLSGTALTNFNAVASASASGIAAVNNMITDAVAAGGTAADIFAAIAKAQTIAQGSLADSINASASTGVSTIKSAADLQAEVNAVVTPNNAPTVAAALSGKATEAGEIVTLNLLSGAKDLDVGETAKLSLSGVKYQVDTATASDTVPAGLSLSSAGVLTIDPNNAAFNALSAGEVQTITVSYTISDSKGGTVAQTATITITGAAQTAVISFATAQALYDANTFYSDDDNVTVDVTSSAISAAGGMSGLSLSELGVLGVDVMDIDGSATNALLHINSAAVEAMSGHDMRFAEGDTITLDVAVDELDSEGYDGTSSGSYLLGSLDSAVSGMSHGLTLSALGALGVDVIDIGGSATIGKLHIDSADTLTMSDAGLRFATGDTITLDVGAIDELDIAGYDGTSSGSYLLANLETTVSSMSHGLSLNALGALGVDVIDIGGSKTSAGNVQLHIDSADTLAMSDAGLSFATGDTITLDVGATDELDIAGYDGTSSGSYLLGSLDSAVSGMSHGLSLSALGTLGVDVIDIGGSQTSAGNVQLHIDSADTLAMSDAGLSFATGDTITLDATADQLSTADELANEDSSAYDGTSSGSYLLGSLDSAVSSMSHGLSLNALGALGVDVIDIGGSQTSAGNVQLHIDSADTLAMSDAGLSFATGDTITLDVGTTDGIDVSGSYLSGSLNDNVSSMPHGLSLNALGSLGVDVIDIGGSATNGVLHIESADTLAMSEAGLSFATGDTITLDVSTTYDISVSGSYLSGSLNSAISKMSHGLSLNDLGSLGVDVIDIDGSDTAATLHLSINDAIAMASAGLSFAENDTVIYDRTHQSVSSVNSFESSTTAEQLASAVGDSLGLHAMGIDQVAVDNGVMVTLHEDAGIAFGGDQSLKDLLIALGDSGITADDMSYSIDAVSAVVVGTEANFAIDDAMVSALMDAGLLTANTDSTIEVDASSEYMSTSLSQLADIGADKVVTSQDVVYVDLGDDVANVQALSTLLTNLAAATFVQTDGETAVAEVGLVLSADQAALATAIEGSSSVLDQLTSAGITELLVACDDTHTTADVTLLGQDYYKVPVAG